MNDTFVSFIVSFITHNEPRRGASTATDRVRELLDKPVLTEADHVEIVRLFLERSDGLTRAHGA